MAKDKLAFEKRQIKLKEKVRTNKVTDLSDFVDMSIELFKEYLEKNTPNLGQTKSLKAMLTESYGMVCDTKDRLVYKVQHAKDEAEKKEAVDTINRLFIILQSIEDKVVLLGEREKSLIEQFGEEQGTN